jgi:hypothetical protein
MGADRPIVRVWIAPGGGAPGAPLDLPAPAVIEPRAWALGVAAVQVVVENGKVTARVRRHETGAEEAEIVPIEAPVIVHACALPPGGEAHIPTIELPTLEADGPLARMAMYVGGAKVAVASLKREDLGLDPAPKAYGHFFCRWLRDGGEEVGCDLTEFQSLTEGEKAHRLLVKTLTTGGVASFALVVA